MRETPVSWLDRVRGQNITVLRKYRCARHPLLRLGEFRNIAAYYPPLKIRYSFSCAMSRVCACSIYLS